MNIEFQGMLCSTSSEAHYAVAGEWLSAGGLNGRDDILQVLRDCSDEDLARECEEGWDMGSSEFASDPLNAGLPVPTWWYSRAELASAFADIRENPDAAFGWDDE